MRNNIHKGKNDSSLNSKIDRKECDQDKQWIYSQGHSMNNLDLHEYSFYNLLVT
jgi:hypothetical protein